MRSLRDAAKKLAGLQVVVLGVSRDDVPAQARFCKAEKLPFDLLSDPTGDVVSRYGAARKRLRWPLRKSVLVDERGIVRHIWIKVDLRKHGEQVALQVAALRKTKEK